MNVLTEEGIAELDAAVDAALADPAVKGIVITSAKPDFAGGMDLNVLAQMRARAGADPARGLFDGTMALHGLLRKIERAGMDPKTLKGGKPVAWAAPGLSAGIGTGSASPATAASWPTTRRPASACPRSSSASSPAPAAPRGSSACSALMAAAPFLLEGKMLRARRPRRPPG